MNIQHKYKIVLSALVSLTLLSGCGTTSEGECSCVPPMGKAQLGAELYSDTTLSRDKTMSCATCHDLDSGFVDSRFSKDDDNNPVHGALSVGQDNVSLGGRNTPTAGYAQFSPDFTFDSAKNAYVGGQFHDGRSKDLQAQAKGPFLDGAEMQMPSAASVVERVQENSSYVTSMKTIYGETIFDNSDTAYDAITDAIAEFEKTELFATFDSKYDKFLRGDYRMTGQEELGYSLFFSTNNTNCVQCHTLNSKSEDNSNKELFTNYEYENVGAPRNLEALAAKNLPLTHTDLGLGGRGDINDTTHYSKFKVPTLRNVAVTGPYMSNGVFKNLRTVLEFYDHMAGQGNHPINPETGNAWLEPEHNATVNYEVLKDTKELTDTKVEALEAFLKLLTDAKFERLLAD